MQEDSYVVMFLVPEAVSSYTISYTLAPSTVYPFLGKSEVHSDVKISEFLSLVQIFVVLRSESSNNKGSLGNGLEGVSIPPHSPD